MLCSIWFLHIVDRCMIDFIQFLVLHACMGMCLIYHERVAVEYKVEDCAFQCVVHLILLTLGTAC